MNGSRLRAALAASAALVIGGAVFLVAPARGAEPAPANGFTCRASVVRTENSSIALANIEPFAANEDGGACDTDSAALVGPQAPVPLPAGLGSLRALYAETDEEANTAEAGVADLILTVGGHTIGAEVLTSEASAGQCPSPGLTGSSKVVNVTVDGTTVAVPQDDAETAVPIPGVGTLHLNYQTNEGGVLTQRALFLDVDQTLLPLVPDVIVAEAIADIHGNPCVEGPPDDPNCDDGRDNDGDGLVDEDDPDCQRPPTPPGDNRCPPASPEGGPEDPDPDKDCGYGKPSDVDEPPKGGRKK